MEKLIVRLEAAVPAMLLLLLGSREQIAALLPAILCHELGHALALWLLGLRIRRFRAELRGFCMEYYGPCSAFGHAAAAAAGPAAGLLWAFAASALGGRLGFDWLLLSSGISLLLSAFNLLPALPLDGGRIALAFSCALFGERRGERLTELSSLTVGALLLCCGIWLMLDGRGIAVLTAAIWLLAYQEQGRGLAKKTEMI